VRLLVVQRERITHWAEAPLEPGWVRGGIIEGQAAVATCIRDLLSHNGVSPREVTCGISGRRALTRPLLLPKLPETTLTGLVLSEARRVLPVPLEELYISWQTRPAGEAKIIAFVAAIPRDIADSYIGTLSQAGIKPRQLHLRPLAMAHLVEDDTAVIVDAQPADFDIVVMVKGLPQPVRNIPFPADAISPAERAMLVAEDLKRTIQFYNENNPETQIDPALPVQVTADPDGEALCRELADLMGRPTVEIPSPFVSPEDFNPAHFATNLAMVKQQRAPNPKAPGARVRLNVLPDAYRPKRVAPIKLALMPLLALLAVATVFMVWFYLSTGQGINSMQTQKEQTEAVISARLAQKQALSEEITALETSIAQSVAESAILGEILKRHSEVQVTTKADLELAVSTLPASFVRLNSITYRGSLLVLGGGGDSETEVLEYARNLEAANPAAGITITNVQFEDYEPVGASDSTPPVFTTDNITDNATMGMPTPDTVGFTFTVDTAVE